MSAMNVPRIALALLLASICNNAYAATDTAPAPQQAATNSVATQAPATTSSAAESPAKKPIATQPLAMPKINDIALPASEDEAAADEIDSSSSMEPKAKGKKAHVLQLPENLYSEGRAAAASPITYAQDQIIILPRAPLIANLKDGALFQVEIKSIGSALNPDWFQLSGFAPNHGLLLTFERSQIIAIEPANIFAHYDVIAVNEFGEVVLILPNIVLASLAEPIYTPEAANSLLYVMGGTSDDIGLQVGDHIQHTMFHDRTKVRDTNSYTPATPAEPVAPPEPATPPIANTPPEPATADVANEPAMPQTPAEPAAPAPVPEVENKTTEPTPSLLESLFAKPAPVNNRRRPMANPTTIAKPVAPTAPVVQEVARPSAPSRLSDAEPSAGAPASTVTNSNLQQTPEVIPPVKSAETPVQKNLLDMILKRPY